jgi:signal transduction histidine kinase/DNA-binding response OmpR family regulator
MQAPERTNTVVVADDQPASRQLVSTLLGYREYRVWEANDGVEALALIETHRPDLLISDLLMPRMDGFELARRIRANGDPAVRSLPIILYTATYHSDQVAELAAECGVAGVIAKPVEPADMYAAVDRARDARRAHPHLLTPGRIDPRHFALVRDKVAEQAARLDAARQRMIDLASLGQSLALVDDSIDASMRFCVRAREILLVREVIVALTDQSLGLLHTWIRCSADGEPLVTHVNTPLTLSPPRAALKEPGVLASPAAEAMFASLRGEPGPCLAAPIAAGSRSYGWVYAGGRLSGTMGNDDEATMAAMAAQLAVSFESAHQGTVARQRGVQLASESAARVHTEAELQDVQEQRHFALKAARCGIWQFNPRTGDVRCDVTMSDVLGVPAAALPTTVGAFLPMVHGDDRQHVAEVLSNSPNAAQIESLELRTVWPDGSVHWLGVEGKVSNVGSGADPVYRGVAIDITDRRQLEEQFRRVQKIEAIGQLAGGVAHDFNNLITAILGFAELIDARLAPDDPTRRDLSEITRAGKRAAGLTRQLLAFSRKQVLQPEPVDINALILNLVPMLARLLGEDVGLDTRLSTGGCRVMADAGQVEQVLMNLAVNARDAMPEGGTLVIATSRVDLDGPFVARHPGSKPGAHVAITVTDTGTGMSAATKEHIFEPFFTTKDQDKGTGLGLSTVYGIVKQSDGYISVSSELGHGSTFDVYLPALAEHNENAASTAKPVKPMVTGCETVLVAEDEDSVRTILQTVLELHGYHVLAARDCLSALTASEHFGSQIDLLVSDVIMPGGTGPQLFRELTKRRPGLKVLYTSGYVHDALGTRGILDPRIPFLQKPFSSEQILRLVRKSLDRATTTLATDAAGRGGTDG